ncbi:MAG: hypothetical protein ACOCQN_00020 [Halanaerobiaceae bacterium]
MYKIYCPECNHYNYSASRAGNWICCYCGHDLKDEVKKQGDSGRKKVPQLA